MDSVLKVNRTFISRDDWKGVLAIILCLFARGKAAETLSEVSRKRLSAFNASSAEFSKAMLTYVGAVLMLSPMDVVFNELVSRLRRFWSHKLTMVLAKKMLSQKLRNEDDDKNFETLVSSEADRFVELQIDLSVEVIEAITHLFFFTRILWRLSPTLGSAGLATAAFGTSMSFLVGRTALARLFREERKANGGVSFELARVNALDSVRQDTTAYRKRAKDLFSLFSLLLRRLAGGIFPSLILRHDHEEGQHHGHGHGNDGHNHSHKTQGHITVGHPKTTSGTSDELVSELVQASDAFDEILFHLLIVSENFHNATRLATLGKDICELLEREQDNSEPVESHIEFVKAQDPSSIWLSLVKLSVSIPRTNQLLLDNLTISLGVGDSLLITGPSGTGKTALLRVLFGLWPAKGGRVLRPDDSSVIALPQKSFCSTGTLADQVTYPRLASEFTDESIRNALKRVGLGHLLQRHDLTAVEKWQEELSMGEMQRLGFARVVLHRPRFGFFDESTSSLDIESETKMYELVTEIVQGGFVSIGHRKSIEKFHLHKITLLGTQSDGKWKQDF